MTRLAVALALCALPAGASQAPTFRPAAGWVVARHPDSQPRSSVVAVTAADARLLHPFAPFVGFTRLSRRGVIVWITIEGRNRPDFPRLRWPLELSTFRVDRGWEGQPAPNLQQRLAAGAVRGWDLDVRIYFATQRPDRKLLERAQAELRRLRLPP